MKTPTYLTLPSFNNNEAAPETRSSRGSCWSLCFASQPSVLELRGKKLISLAGEGKKRQS